jgi:hypothetical protein
MQKTILVPTDFRIESLNTLKLALKQNEQYELKVVLLYAELQSDSITDLIFYSPQKIIQSHITQGFRDAISILQNRFGPVFAGLKIELFHGHTNSAFANFLQARGVSEIYVPGRYSLQATGRAFDPAKLINTSGLPVFKMDWEPAGSLTEADQLHTLFHS